jgi:hypothetical protein
MKKGPTFLQAFLLTISGAALAFFGCLGALTTMGRDQQNMLGTVGGLAFVAGLLMLMIGMVLLGYVIIRAIVKAIRGDPPSLPPDAQYPPSTRYGGTERDPHDPNP